MAKAAVKKVAKRRAAKPKKAHDAEGKFVADGPSTPENEYLAVSQERLNQRSVGMRRLGGRVVG
jgi:hypothetical protein